MKRRTKFITLSAVTAAAAVGAGAIVYGGGGNGASATGKNGELPPASTKITRTDLVRSETVDGRLDFAERRGVKSPVEGTVTVAADEGSTVTMGQRLYELDDKPVTLLYGQVPMFREMKDGDRGTDVLQLERNLRDLGFGAGLYVDVRYDKATEAAVKSWQKSLNRETTGKVGQGHVVFQPDAVRVVSADAALADTVGADRTVLTVASTKPVVRAELDQTDGALAAKGTEVEVTLPSGKTERGKVSGTVKPTSAEGTLDSGGEDGITVEITLNGGKSATEPSDSQGTSSVKFISESRENVLTVPVEAVVALRGENGYGLEVIQGGRPTRMVRIETGMTADGRIEITGEDIAEGMKVGVAQQ